MLFDPRRYLESIDRDSLNPGVRPLEGPARATRAIRAIPPPSDSTNSTNSTAGPLRGAHPMVECPPMARALMESCRFFGSSPNSTSSTSSTAQAPLTEILMAEDLALRFEEVAGILEYDEGLPRAEAERLARLRVYGGAQ